jgi:hypothetical protein
MSVLKTTGIAACAVALALVGGGVGLWYYLGHAGPSRLEQWIGQQIVTVVEGYVTPRIEFKTLEYQAPRTVVIDGLRFTAEDHPILALDRIVLELAEIPRVGQPILIQRVDVTRPQLQFVSDRSGGLVGWSHFVRPGVHRNPPPPGRRFSDILVLRNVSIDDGQVLYDAADGSPPMHIPGITLKLNTPKIENQPGCYQLAGVLERVPIFHVNVDGRINLDTGVLDLASLDLKATMGEEQYGTLPPQAQQFLREHQVQGALALNLQGQIPLADPAKSDGHIRADVQGARFAYAGLTVPAEHIQLEAQLPAGPVQLDLASVALGAGDHSFFSLKRLAMAVTKISTGGGPVQIDNLLVEGPRVAFIRDPAGGFVGWNRLKTVAAPRAKPSTQPAADIAKAVVVEQLQIRDAGVAYASDPAAKPASIEGIDLTLRTQPQPDGTYQVDGDVKRAPLFTGEIAARADLASGVIQVQKVTASAKLSEADYAALPPEAVSLLRQYRIQGQVSASAEGRVLLHALAESAGHADVELKDVAFDYQGVRMPVRHAQVAADLPNGGVKITAESLGLESADLTLLAVEKAAVDLASLPRAGQPIQLDRVVVDHPQFRFVRSEGGEIAGWSHLMAGPSSTSSREISLKQLQVTRAAALWQAPGQAPISVQDVNVNASAIPEEGGIYALKGQLTREKLLELAWEGRLDPKTMVLDLAGARLSGHIDRGDYAALPDAMRSTLESYGLLGQVAASWKGRIPLKQPSGAAGELKVDVRDGRAVYQGVTIELARLQGGGKLPDGQLLVSVDDLAMQRRDQKLLSTRQATIELPLPRAGQPLQITRLELDAPNAILTQRKDGTFTGWSELTGVQGGDNTRGADNTPAPLLKSLRIRNGRFEYRSADAPRMLLAGIDLNATGRMRQDRIESYSLTGSVRAAQSEGGGSRGDNRTQSGGSGEHGQPRAQSEGTSGGGELRFEGVLQPATWVLDVSSLSGRTTLDEAQVAMLPPAAQTFLRDHQLRGQLDVQGRARVPLKQTDRATAEWKVELRSGRVAIGSSVLPVDQLSTTGKLADSRLRADFNANLLGGSANGSLDYPLTGSQPLRLTWTANGLQLERTLAAASGQASNYSGSLSSSGQLSARPAAFEQTISGGGSLNISNGQLVNVPIIHEILAVASAANLGRVLGRGREQRADTAQVSFEFRPDGIAITQGQVNSPVIKLTGSGRVGYDSSLDLNVRANVLQQVQNLEKQITGGAGGLLGRAVGGRGVGRIIGGTIGPAGQAVSKLGDRMVTYRITGTTSNPRVVPQPLGLGR